MTDKPVEQTQVSQGKDEQPTQDEPAGELAIYACDDCGCTFGAKVCWPGKGDHVNASIGDNGTLVLHCAHCGGTMIRDIGPRSWTPPTDEQPTAPNDDPAWYCAHCKQSGKSSAAIVHPKSCPNYCAPVEQPTSLSAPLCTGFIVTIKTHDEDFLRGIESPEEVRETVCAAIEDAAFHNHNIHIDEEVHFTVEVSRTYENR